MSPLESRKQLLIAESELNRAELVQEWKAMADGFHSVADRAKSFGAVASSAAALAASLAAFQGGGISRNGAKPTWLRKVLKGAGLVSSLWVAFRAVGRAAHHVRDPD
jgi:hypothetical protein